MDLEIGQVDERGFAFMGNIGPPVFREPGETHWLRSLMEKHWEENVETRGGEGGVTQVWVKLTWESLDKRTRIMVLQPLFKRIIERVGEGYSGDLITLIKEDREAYGDTYKFYEVGLLDKAIATLLPHCLDAFEENFCNALGQERADIRRLEENLQRFRDVAQQTVLFLDNINKTREWLQRQ